MPAMSFAECLSEACQPLLQPVFSQSEYSGLTLQGIMSPEIAEKLEISENDAQTPVIFGTNEFKSCSKAVKDKKDEVRDDAEGLYYVPQEYVDYKVSEKVKTGTAGGEILKIELTKGGEHYVPTAQVQGQSGSNVVFTAQDIEVKPQMLHEVKPIPQESAQVKVKEAEQVNAAVNPAESAKQSMAAPEVKAEQAAEVKQPVAAPEIKAEQTAEVKQPEKQPIAAPEVKAIAEGNLAETVKQPMAAPEVKAIAEGNLTEAVKQPVAAPEVKAEQTAEVKQSMAAPESEKLFTYLAKDEQTGETKDVGGKVQQMFINQADMNKTDVPAGISSAESGTAASDAEIITAVKQPVIVQVSREIVVRIEQINELTLSRINVSEKPTVTKFEMMLNPAHLGKVEVRLAVDGMKMSVKIITQSDAARDLLSARMSSVRVLVEMTGISVERYEVVSAQQAEYTMVRVEQDFLDRQDEESKKEQNESDGEKQNEEAEISFAELMQEMEVG
jgi:flagellar hook-length control protein FliK